ncbi:hypothetical protein Trco_002785 [Trichoderma cornu-damae]|uniref:Uncharacterized protein n=1 Tax=Trichoderma cornu-damae TaxID=654480 RepID=A0A9P8TY55_9HYPO|nr:hypothetical protein Trco_002785 [Trichoderma cornu-damae]
MAKTHRESDRNNPFPHMRSVAPMGRMMAHAHREAQTHGRLTHSIDPRGSRSPSKSERETSERSYGRPYASGMMDADVGSCHMASTFYEIFRESGLQRQLENGWGRAYSDVVAEESATSPTSESHRSQTRRRPKASSPPGARKHAQNRGSIGSRGPKSKRPRSGQVKEEDADDDTGATHAMQEPSKSRSPKRDSHHTTESGEGYKLNGKDYGGRDYMSGLNTELDTLRKHLLQRANPPRSFS